jgi:chromosome segregation ATPase
MPTTNVQDLEARVEAIEEEIEELTRRRAEALAQIQRAEVRFSELEERRAVLAPKTFSGDEEATAELEGLEDEHDQLARSVRVARAAVPEFEKMIAEAEERASEARTDIYRQRYEALYEEARALDDERDELARRLVEVLEKQSSLNNDASQALRYYNGDQANALSMGFRPAVQSFVDQTFYKWLH